MISDKSKEGIASILASCKAKIQQTSTPAENSRRDHASQPVQSSTLAKARKPTPSFNMAEAFKYMGHFMPMWVSDTNDPNTHATMIVIRLEQSSSDGRLWIWSDEPWVAFDTIDMPRRVARATSPNMSERGMIPGCGQAPMASQSLVIRQRGKGKSVAGDEGEDKEKGRVLSYLTPLDEDAIGETGEGWLSNVMLYVWATANARKKQ